MKYDQVEKLIEAVSKSDLTEFKFEEEGVKLSLKKEEKTVVVEAPHMMAQAGGENGAGGSIPAAGAMAVAAEETASGTATAAGTAGQPEVMKAGQIVTSPLVGIFYTAPSEDSDAFVSVGDTVKVGQVLAIVEAMKLMNEIDSELEGTVTEILVKNGEAVEYGQPLFRIA